MKTCNSNNDVRVTFSNMEGLTIFSNSPQRLNVLRDSCPERLPRNSGIRWIFDHRSISKIKYNFHKINTVLTRLEIRLFLKKLFQELRVF